MNKNLYVVVCLMLAIGLVILMSGCNRCGPSRFNLRPFQNRPVRSAIDSCLYGGDACNTCNPPAGQPANCDSNVAPLCDGCSAGEFAQPVYSGEAAPGIPYYGETNLNPPITTPGPIYNETESYIQNEPPASEIYGTSAATDIVPPNF
jgi:hypothetical protein